MAATRAKILANMRYREKTYDRIAVDLKKGTKDFYRSEAAKRGLSLAMLVQNAVEDYLKNNPPKAD